MKRLDDLLEAATSRFRYDAGLREEIARELRAHLEDSIAAARADGKNDAEAEEAAIRAFGDPEEVGEKLWQANRRRLRNRAVVMAAVGVVLLPAGVLALGWLITWFLSENVGPVGAVSCILTFALICLLTRLFLPKTAFFGLGYLRWLPAAFGKSIRTAFRNPWIWAPALVFFASLTPSNLLMMCHLYASHNLAPEFQGGRWWEFIHYQLYRVTPNLPNGLLWLLPPLGYLVFARRLGKWLPSVVNLAPGRVRRWHWAFTVSATAGMLLAICGSLSLLEQLTSWRFSQFEYLFDGRFFIIISYWILDAVSVPIQALAQALFLTIVIRRLRGQPLSPAGVVNSAFVVIRPMIWLLIALVVGQDAINIPLYIAQVRSNALQLDAAQVSRFLHLAMAFLPVIIISEQCGFRRACVRFGDFVRRHLWRYVAFVFLGALLLGLPRWATGAAFGSASVSWPVYLWVTLAQYSIQFALELGLAVMCFEFYLTRAGTVAPPAAEELSPPQPSEASR